MKTTSALIHFNKQLIYMPHKREIYVWWKNVSTAVFAWSVLSKTSRNCLRFSFNFISSAHYFDESLDYYGNKKNIEFGTKFSFCWSSIHYLYYSFPFSQRRDKYPWLKWDKAV